MAASVQIHTTAGNGKTLKQFANILQKRMEYLHETARDSIIACALQVLRSIRTATLVAKLSKVKINLVPNNSLYLSYTTHGGRKSLCLRIKGSNVRYSGKEKMVLASHAPHGHETKSWHVYEFVDEFSKQQTKYLIVSSTASLAKAKAKDLVKKRVLRYAGLARCAISLLMHKTFASSPVESISHTVASKAYELTNKYEKVSKYDQSKGGTYALTLVDELLYALDAIRGGRGTVDTQMKKALNKIVSVINHKIPDGKTLFDAEKLPTPFPEVRSRKQ